MPLYRILYRSEIVLSDGQQPDHEIELIVQAAAEANTKNNISGALIASNGIFIQALEGPLSTLESTFEKICTDLRHKNVRLIELAAADERVFAEWSMVRVEQKDGVLRLCSDLGRENSARLDGLKTSDIIKVMRSILASKLNVENDAEGVAESCA